MDAFIQELPIVTAKKLMEHKRAFGALSEVQLPETVLICYQRSTMEFLLKGYPEFKPSKAVTHFYINEEGTAGILGDWGVGAPGLAIKMEELIALGIKKFIAIGTAGGLMHAHEIADFIICPAALAEDGVAQHYLPVGQKIALPSASMREAWDRFAKENSLPEFKQGMAWSFSAIFRESIAHMERVMREGCSVVEMEAATLYAIAQEKGVEALTLFVISDLIREDWMPRTKDPKVRSCLHQLAEWALAFSRK